MAGNLLSTAMQLVTPDLVSRIGGSLGRDRNSTQSLVGAAVPALLAAFGSVTTQPGGAQKLADAARQYALNGHGGAAGSLADDGSPMLSSIFGGQGQNALADTIGKFSGLAQSKSSTLLSMLTPLVMGGIVKNLAGRGVDASEMTNLFAANKNEIAAALPSGLRDQLSGMLPSLRGVAGTATSAASQAAQTASDAVGRAADRTASAGGAAAATSTRWLYWIVPAALVIAVLYLLLPIGRIAQQAPSTAASLSVGGVDVGAQVTDGLASLRTSLQSVTDPASARAALPKLQALSATFDKVGSVAGQLAPDQHKSLVGLIAPAMGDINQLFAKMLAIPGVADVLQPTCDALKAKLAALST